MRWIVHQIKVLLIWKWGLRRFQNWLFYENFIESGITAEINSKGMKITAGNWSDWFVTVLKNSKNLPINSGFQIENDRWLKIKFSWKFSILIKMTILIHDKMTLFLIIKRTQVKKMEISCQSHGNEREIEFRMEKVYFFAGSLQIEIFILIFRI